MKGCDPFITTLHDLELDEIEAALELVDASQLLSRVSRCSHDVGARWQELADCRAQPAAGGYYVFNDMHALMAYASAGRDDQVRGILATLTQRAIDPDTNGRSTREVGLPLARALASERTEHKPASTRNSAAARRCRGAPPEL